MNQTGGTCPLFATETDSFQQVQEASEVWPQREHAGRDCFYSLGSPLVREKMDGAEKRMEWVH